MPLGAYAAKQNNEVIKKYLKIIEIDSYPIYFAHKPEARPS
jgi:hypothetical protein